MNKNKFISFKTKIILTLLPLLIFFALFCLAVIKGGEQISLNKSLAARADVTAESLAIMSGESLRDSGNTAKAEKLQEWVRQLSEQPNSALIQVLNSSGKVKACSDKSKIGKVLNTPSVTKALGTDTPYFESASLEKEECILSVVPIRHSDTNLGAVMVYLSKAELNAVTSGLKRQLLGLIFVLAAFTLLFAALMTCWYGNPLLAFAETLEALAQGHLDAKADASRSDELGLAAIRANRLADYLQNIITASKNDLARIHDRIRSLRVFIDGVLAGDTESQAPVTNIDEIGQLAMGLNETVRHMRTMRATEEALQYRINAAERDACPTLGDFNKGMSLGKQNNNNKADKKPKSGQAKGGASAPASKGGKEGPMVYKNRVLPDSETVIAMTSPQSEAEGLKGRSAQNDPDFRKAAANIRIRISQQQPLPLVDTLPSFGADENDASVPNPQEAFAAVQAAQNQNQNAAVSDPDWHENILDSQEELIPIGEEVDFGKSAQLSNSQIDYINKLNRLGSGKNVLIATGGTDDSYPFLKKILVREGFNVVHAGTIAEMLEIASNEAIDLIMVEFNDMDGGNQHAVNRLRNIPECAHISVIVLEAAFQTDVPYASMYDVIQIIIPNSDEELINMIREALAEILLTGGSNPFVN